MEFKGKLTSLFLLCITSLTFVCANEIKDDTITKAVVTEEWLISNVYPFSNPAFFDKVNIKGEKLDNSLWLKMPNIDMQGISEARPRNGLATGLGDVNDKWKKVEASVYKESLQSGNKGAWQLYANYLNVASYGKLKLKLNFAPVFELYLDGKKILNREKVGEKDSLSQIVEISKEIDMEPGFHVLLIRAMLTEEGSNVVSMPEMSIEYKANKVSLGLEEKEFYSLDHYMFAPSISGAKLSSDGAYYFLSRLEVTKDRNAYERSNLLGQTANGKIVNTYTGISNFSFAPMSPYYGYMKKSGKSKRIYLGRLGEEVKLAYETKDNLVGFTWAPKGDFLILSFLDKPEKNTTGLKSLSSPEDQWPDYKERVSLFRLDLNNLQAGIIRPLTFGSLSVSLQDINADGSKIMFSTFEIADTIRNFTRNRLYCMDLNTMQVEELCSNTLSEIEAYFLPDGRSLFVIAPEGAFPNLDAEKPEYITNDYNRCVFIYDLQSKKAEFVGKDFKPSVQGVKLDPTRSCAYFTADNKDEVNLFAYKIDSKSFYKIPTNCHVVSSFDLSANKLIYVGASAIEPIRAYMFSGNTSKPTSLKNAVTISDPQAFLADNNVQYNDYIDLRLPTPFGDSIDGTLYLPCGKSLEELSNGTDSYPCITYYYGGTTPTPKMLAMRYPKEVWASHGYAVLVLQPSGAIGYGSEFAARHVNNWGKTVGDEIIMGVKETYRKYNFIDSTKIGCIGASYGGFMTQYLISVTDIFSAAISHAGISSISSYWGEGFWGFLYNGVAAANSYPWNNPDVYIKQSPLFSADKINTPLLLLHGTSDNNVPIGESYQMYKALRILGRPVAMVTVEGEDHGIVDMPKRILWERTILAWFDRYLKGEPSWWNGLYPSNPE